MQALRSPERADELTFEIVFGCETLACSSPANSRSLHQQNVDAARRIRDHRLEQSCLAPVSPEIARIEHPLAVRLDQQGIGIERAVIDEIRRDPERPGLHRLAVRDEAGVGESVAVRDVTARCLQNVVRILADPDGDVRTDVPLQSVVVHVRMRNQNAEQTVVSLAETRDPRQQAFACGLVFGRVERQSDIEGEALALRLDLDAGPADFLRPPMDAKPHVPIPSKLYEAIYGCSATTGVPVPPFIAATN